MTISRFGWNDNLASEAEALRMPGTFPARITADFGSHIIVVCEKGERKAVIQRRARELFAEAGIYPAVGDWVLCTHNEGDAMVAIRAILERRSAFNRVDPSDGYKDQCLAANIDVAFLAMSANGNFNVRRMERFLIGALESGAMAVALITKADLVDETTLARMVEEVENLGTGMPVVPVSSFSGRGLAIVASWLGQGQTGLLVGSSGVGKSSLLNAISGEKFMKVKELRSKLDKGQHTTTHRQLFLLPETTPEGYALGGMLVDIPGIRVFSLPHDADSTSELFADLCELDARCRFSDCRHLKDPGCALQVAVEAGDVENDRVHAWLNLRAEEASKRLTARERVQALRRRSALESQGEVNRRRKRADFWK